MAGTEHSPGAWRVAVGGPTHNLQRPGGPTPLLSRWGAVGLGDLTGPLLAPLASRLSLTCRPARPSGHSRLVDDLSDGRYLVAVSCTPLHTKKC